jgi:hypothetical protein
MALGLLIGYPFVRRARRRKRLAMEEKWRQEEALVETESPFDEDEPSQSP